MPVLIAALVVAYNLGRQKNADIAGFSVAAGDKSWDDPARGMLTVFAFGCGLGLDG